jgi:hypothetical protein
MGDLGFGAEIIELPVLGDLPGGRPWEWHGDVLRLGGNEMARERWHEAKEEEAR